MISSLLLQVNIQNGMPDTTAAAVETTEKSISIMDMIINGGLVMIPIGILSIIAVYIFIERYMAIKNAAREEPDFMNNIKDFIHEGKVEAARDLCNKTESPIAKMLQKGISRIGKSLNDISAAIENVGKLEIYKLEKSLATLATVAGAAPMLGFLGTVIGMIQTFHEMYTHGSDVDIGMLSGGIMQAMVTTVAGLIVGIVAYIGYNILVAKVEKVIYKMEASTIEFMDLLQEPA